MVNKELKMQVCEEHGKLSKDMEVVKIKVDFLYQDAKQRKERYDRLKDRKDKNRMWLLGGVFTLTLTTISYIESIREYLKAWLLR